MTTPNPKKEEIFSEEPEKALTCIHPPYTLTTTFSGEDDLNGLMVKQFLSTLADVAMAIASRHVDQSESEADHLG
ncbi:MAG: hypothetical protein TUN42_07570 [Dehalogenimonas sp.]